MIDLYGRISYSESDLCQKLLQDPDILKNLVLSVDNSVDNEKCRMLDIDFICQPLKNLDLSVEEFDTLNQQQWFMPDSYKQLDIAEHVLSLCNTQEQLQRAGQELLIYAEKNLFDLLRYLKYLVDVMKSHDIIWGVGRGSSVASYVLYLLEVHKIDSLYYDLDIDEFLR